MSKAITVTARYLMLPVNSFMQRKNVAFYVNGELVYDFYAHIDCQTPHFISYADLSHLRGKTLTLTITPEIDFDLVFCDEIPEDLCGNKILRPFVHFSTRIGWINDPNGLVYHNGEYHLFYQHNPLDNVWDNMSWGHAISRDLLHWKELGDALLPDRLGTMFSGSAITDTDNRSGLGSKDSAALLLYYTAAGGNSLLSEGQPFTQCLAYSLDNGRTFRKYENNPIIPHIIGGNRDPKIIYVEELKSYLLALYLDGDEYALFRSDDLLHFEKLQRLHLPGDDECPDLYPLYIEGTKVKKWIFSGASDRYLVGDLDEHGFHPVQDVLPYFYGRRTSYAAQTFSGSDPRRIKIAWDVLHAPDQIFENQMGIPCEVSLTELDGLYRLRTNPVKEFDSLREDSRIYSLNDCIFKATLQYKAYDILLSSDRLPDCTISLFGHNMTVKTSDNTFCYHGVTLPLSYTKTGVSLRIIADTLGLEIFLDDGLLYTVKDGLCDFTVKYLEIKASSPLSGSLAIHGLTHIPEP